MKPIELSVVLATFNEERNIRDCLESVLKIADEIIIVDGRSSDQTALIARQMGARVIETENNPQFHVNKQKAIDLANGKWVLQLDADERLSMELVEEIKKEIAIADNDIAGYFLPRKNWFLGKFLKKGGAYPDPVLRLFQKGKGSFTKKNIIDNGITTSNVHAQLNVDGKTKMLQHDLIHYGDKNIAQYLKRFNRYTQLEAENLAKLKLGINFKNGINYIILKPIYWFFKRFIRHRGYIDGYQGFLFAVLSAMHYPVIYYKLVEICRRRLIK